MMTNRPDLIPQIETAYKNHGGLVSTEFNLGAIRFDRNLLDDTFGDILFCYRPYYKELWLRKGTCCPGAHAVLNKEGGAAMVKDGYYADRYVIGNHPRTDNEYHYQHTAFVERPEYGTGYVNLYRLDRTGKPVKEERSNEYGLNRHRASKYDILAKIGPYGEGCSVSQDAKDHEQEVAWGMETTMYKANKLYKFALLQIASTEIVGL